MQFLVVAWDGKDSEAKSRRQAARQARLEGVHELRASGNFINGGAILDDEGEMIGSTLYMEFSSRDALEQWLSVDPYITGKVWDQVEIKVIRLVP